MITPFTLSNGIKAVHDYRPDSGLFNVRIMIGSGSADDGLEKNGLSDLTLDCLKTGTMSMTREQITERLHSLGADIGCSAGRETSHIELHGLAENKEAAFEILADIIHNPAFRDAEIAQQKNITLSHLRRAAQDLGSINGDNFMKAAYAGQSYGLDVLGTEEHVNGFTSADIKARYKSLFGDLSNIVISFTGDITAEDAQKMAENHFGSMAPKGEPVPKASKPVFTPGDIRTPMPTTKLPLSLGFEAPPRTSAQRFVYIMLNEALGGGMSSPLFREIREKRSLVYGIGSQYLCSPEKGLFFIGGSTEGPKDGEKAKADEMIRETINLLGKIAKDGFSDAEIESARNSILRDHESSRETARNAGNINADSMLSRGFISSREMLAAGIAQVTNDDIRRACADLTAEGRYVLSATGPVEGIPSPDSIKSMMQAQIKGLDLPPARPLQEVFIKPAFHTATAAIKIEPSTPKKTILPNGLTVLTVERPGLVSCGMWVGVGAKDESKAQSGASHMIEHMMFKGTPSFAPGEISKTVQSKLGGDLNAYTSHDMTAYYFYNLLPEHLSKVTQICGEMVFMAHIDETEYAGGPKTAPDGSTYRMRGEREVVLKEINDSIADPQDMIWDRLFATAYAGQSMGRPVLGTKRSLNRRSAADLRAYRDMFYAPNNTTFVCVGPVKHADAVSTVEALFGHLPPSASLENSRSPDPVFKTGKAIKAVETSTLTTAQLAFKAPDSLDDRCRPADYMAHLLGGTANSPLYKILKLETNLLDSAGANHYSGDNHGIWFIRLSGEAKNMRKAIEIVCTQIAALPETIDHDDLETIKTLDQLQLAGSQEQNRNFCHVLGSHFTETGEIKTTHQEIADINAVTLDEVRAEAIALLKAPVAVAYVTPPGVDPALLPGVQEINTLRRKALQNLKATPAMVVPTEVPSPGL